MSLFRRIRESQEAHDLRRFYPLARKFLADHPDHRAADDVRYRLAETLVAENIAKPTTDEAKEAMTLLAVSAEKARTADRRFDAALLLLKFEPTADPGGRARAMLARFGDHRDADEVRAWAFTELEADGKLDEAAVFAEEVLARDPRHAMAEPMRRLLTRRKIKGAKAPLTADEERVIRATGGKIVVLDFFATWCVPCVQSTPKLVELERRLFDRGLRVVAFDMDDDAKAADAFAKANGARWPMIPASFDGDVDDRFGVKELPTYLILDATSLTVIETELEGDRLHRRVEELLR